jgi:hypothetical protein
MMTLLYGHLPICKMLNGCGYLPQHAWRKTRARLLSPFACHSSFTVSDHPDGGMHSLESVARRHGGQCTMRASAAADARSAQGEESSTMWPSRRVDGQNDNNLFVERNSTGTLIG